MAEETEGLVDVILLDAGDRRTGIYHMVDRKTDLNVKQARKLVDAAPQPIITRMPKVEADAIKIELEALGARVELKPSDDAIA